MADASNASFPLTYSSSSSTLVNANDYSTWYQPPQHQKQSQQQEPQDEQTSPSPEPEPEHVPGPMTAQQLVSPETLKAMYAQLPPLPTLPGKKTPAVVDSTTKNRLRRERAKEKERQRPGVSALLPDEIIIEPPHNPDEKASGKFVRPCSMARQDIPQGIRCVAMLKADYVYRMCDGCRMRFKLAEVRSKGIRYQGKFKARAETGDARGSKFTKARPYLIQYNDELILDPAFMHLYELDPRMFGAEAAQLSAARNEENNFLAALKAAEIAAGVKPTEREGSTEVCQTTELTAITPTQGNNSELAQAMPHLPSEANPQLNSTPGASSSSQQANPPREPPDDGLLRVRICSVKNCHHIVPLDYAWKMCATCRDNYKSWGVEKRARRRERKVENMTPEKREKFLKERARREQAENSSVPKEFDPTLPPRSCSIQHCKNHLPEDSPFSRCDYHRMRDAYREQLAKKRQTPRQIFNQAVEMGRDPVEAIKEFLLKQEEEKKLAVESDGEEEVDVSISKGKDKGKKKRTRNSMEPNELNANDDIDGIPQRMRRIEGVTICWGPKCQNLLLQEVQHKLCETCRGYEYTLNLPRPKKAKTDGSCESSFETIQYVVNPSQPQKDRNGSGVVTLIPDGSHGLKNKSDVARQPYPGENNYRGVFPVNGNKSILAPQWSGIISSHTPIVGWTDYYERFNQPQPPFKTAQSSLQGAIDFDNRDESSATILSATTTTAITTPAGKQTNVSATQNSSLSTPAGFEYKTRHIADDSFRTQTAPVASDQQDSRNITFLPPNTVSSGRSVSRISEVSTRSNVSPSTENNPPANRPPSPSSALADAIAKTVVSLPSPSVNTSTSVTEPSSLYSTPIADAIAKAVSSSATLSNMIVSMGPSSSDVLASAIAKAISVLPTSRTMVTPSPITPVPPTPPPLPPKKRKYNKRSNKATASAQIGSQEQSPSSIQVIQSEHATGVYPYGYMQYTSLPPNSYPPYPNPLTSNDSPSSTPQTQEYAYPSYLPRPIYPRAAQGDSSGQTGQSQMHPQYPYYPYSYSYPYPYPRPPPSQPSNEPSAAPHSLASPPNHASSTSVVVTTASPPAPAERDITASFPPPGKSMLPPTPINHTSPRETVGQENTVLSEQNSSVGLAHVANTETAPPSGKVVAVSTDAQIQMKICGSAKCSNQLPPNYSRKHCPDCRSKLKIKKKITDMKKRLKLGGS